MKKTILILFTCLISVHVFARTKLTGEAAFHLYSSIPSPAHPLSSDRYFKALKIAGLDVFCTEQINGNRFEYRCSLPDQNAHGKIILGVESSQVFFQELKNRNLSLTLKDAGRMTCEEVSGPDEQVPTTYKCTITLPQNDPSAERI